MEARRSKRHRAVAADAQEGTQQRGQNSQQPKKKRKTHATATRRSEHAAGQIPSAELSTIQEIVPGSNVGREVFHAELEALEIALGYTGRLSNYSVEKQRSAGFDVYDMIEKMTSRWLAVITNPETPRGNKSYIISCYLALISAVLAAPPSYCARICRQDSRMLGNALMKTMGTLTLEELAEKGTDQAYIDDLVEVIAEAKSYGVVDRLKLAEAMTIFKTAASSLAPDVEMFWPDLSTELTAAEWKREYDQSWVPDHPEPLGKMPWYPRVLNKIVVPIVAQVDTDSENGPVEEALEVVDFSDVTVALGHDLGYDSSANRLGSEKALAKRARELINSTRDNAHHILMSATSPGAAWKTTINAASALLAICDLLAPRPWLIIDNPTIWIEVTEKLRASPICPDQYLKRLVQFLAPEQRLRLSREKTPGGQGTIFQNLEKLMRRTRKMRAMSALETVRDLLLLAEEEVADA